MRHTEGLGWGSRWGGWGWNTKSDRQDQGTNREECHGLGAQRRGAEPGNPSREGRGLGEPQEGGVWELRRAGLRGPRREGSGSSDAKTGVPSL